MNIKHNNKNLTFLAFNSSWWMSNILSFCLGYHNNYKPLYKIKRDSIARRYIKIIFYFIFKKIFFILINQNNLKITKKISKKN